MSKRSNRARGENINIYLDFVAQSVRVLRSFDVGIEKNDIFHHNSIEIGTRCEIHRIVFDGLLGECEKKEKKMQCALVRRVCIEPQTNNGSRKSWNAAEGAWICMKSHSWFCEKPDKAVTENAISVTLIEPFIGCLKTPFHTCFLECVAATNANKKK